MHGRFVWKNREKKYLAVGWLWYLGTGFPMIGLHGVFVAVEWMVADGF